jgi:hypothetical protein
MVPRLDSRNLCFSVRKKRDAFAGKAKNRFDALGGMLAALRCLVYPSPFNICDLSCVIFNIVCLIFVK